MPGRHLALIITSFAAVLICAAWLLWRADSSGTQELSHLQQASPQATITPAGPTASAPTSFQLTTPSTGTPSQAVAFDTTNLFSVFQLAIGSPDPMAIERGLSAWRTCAGYVGMGSWDIETWINVVIPDGLELEERDRRANHGRASAARCAGFAGQATAAEQAEMLSKRALELGVVSEQLRSAMYETPRSSWDRNTRETIASLSCAVISQYPENKHGVRLISVAMREAAASRPSHILNMTSDRARTIAINLAFCDLDPDGCSAHSNAVGSACMQSGACSYAREEDYWLAITPPDVFADAQPLRAAVVRLTKQAACNELFN